MVRFLEFIRGGVLKHILCCFFLILFICTTRVEVFADTSDSVVTDIIPVSVNVSNYEPVKMSDNDSGVDSEYSDGLCSSTNCVSVLIKKTSVEEKETNIKNLGIFDITAYDTTECLGDDGNLIKTASGMFPKAGHTVAVDRNIIPLGSKLMIDGIIYTAEDTGSKVQGKVLDIFFDTHEETEDFGRQQKTVYMVLD